MTAKGSSLLDVQSALSLPYPSGDPKLELLPFSSGEKECHVTLDYETIMAVPYLLMALTYASRGSFPYEFPSMCSDFKSVAKGSCFDRIAHETEKCNVNWCNAKLEGFKMQAEVMAVTVEYLANMKIVKVISI